MENCVYMNDTACNDSKRVNSECAHLIYTSLFIFG